MQKIITELDKKEKPLLVNPEQVSKSFLKENLHFNFEGKIFSINERLDCTIRICNLNRNELIEKRSIILNDIKNSIKRKKLRFNNHKDRNRYKKDLKDIADGMIAKIEENRAFSAWQRFLIQDFKEIEKQSVS